MWIFFRKAQFPHSFGQISRTFAEIGSFHKIFNQEIRVNYDIFRSTSKTDIRSSKIFTSQKMKFSIEDFFSKCDQIRIKLRIWSHLLKKSLMKNFIFCAVFKRVNNHTSTQKLNYFDNLVYLGLRYRSICKLDFFSKETLDVLTLRTKDVPLSLSLCCKIKCWLQTCRHTRPF